MRCPMCGNEVRPEEAFCGQCGTPNQPQQPRVRSTEMMQAPPPRSGLLSSYNTHNPNSQNAPFAPPQPPMYNNTGMQSQPVANTHNTRDINRPVRPSSANVPQQIQLPPLPPSVSQQQGGFYQDATEAMSALPNNGQGYPTGYSHYAQPPVQSASQVNNYPNQYGAQDQQPFVTNHGYDYGTRGRLTPPPQKQHNGVVVAIVCVCVIITLIAVVALGTVLLLRNHSGHPVVVQPTTIPTAAATPIPSPVDTPAPSLTVDPTAVPTLTPTPAVTTPTPQPADPGFTWCGQNCTNNGFLVEYPPGWTSTPSTNEMLFTHPTQSGVSAAFKVTGATNDSAQTLLTNDLQTNFATSKDGYVFVGPQAATTIGGETWVTALANYQLNGQKERVVVYTTVHQGRGYIIELQAPDAQFGTLNNQYFVNMTGSFQFQPLPAQ